MKVSSPPEQASLLPVKQQLVVGLNARLSRDVRESRRRQHAISCDSSADAGAVKPDVARQWKILCASGYMLANM